MKLKAFFLLSILLAAVLLDLVSADALTEEEKKIARG
ncbi:unnamed protein product [Rhodiola kirilowii]